jgi:hypothetical protein
MKHLLLVVELLPLVQQNQIYMHIFCLNFDPKKVEILRIMEENASGKQLTMYFGHYIFIVVISEMK